MPSPHHQPPAFLTWCIKPSYLPPSLSTQRFLGYGIIPSCTYLSSCHFIFTNSPMSFHSCKKIYWLYLLKSPQNWNLNWTWKLTKKQFLFSFPFQIKKCYGENIHAAFFPNPRLPTGFRQHTDATYLFCVLGPPVSLCQLTFMSKYIQV